MATGLTPIYLIPYPLAVDPVNVHGDMEDLALQVEDVLFSKPDKNLPNTLTKTNTYILTGTDNGLIIDQSGTGVPLRITNKGTGNSFLVEDVASTDSTPFVINASGLVGIGKTVPTVLLDVAGVGAFSGALTALTVNDLTLSSFPIGFSIGGGVTSKTLTLNNTLTLSGTDSTIMTFPSTSQSIAGLTATQTFTNKSLSDSTTYIVDAADVTKRLQFEVNGTAGITGAFATNFTTTKTVTFQDVTGTVYVSSGDDISLADGGTNASLSASDGGIVYSTASAMAILSGTATAGKMLQSGASTAPTWSTATFPSTATGTGTILRADGTNWVATTATYPTTTNANQILYSSATDTVGGITTANNQVLVTSGSGVPAFSGTLPSGVTASSLTSFGTSPTLTTPTIDTINASAVGSNALLWNTVITTGSISTGGALTIGSINIGNGTALTSGSSINIASGSGVTTSVNIASVASTAGTRTVNIGTLGAAGSTTTIGIGSSNGSTTTVNGTIILPSSTTRVGNTSLIQGGTVNITFPTLAGTLVGTGDSGSIATAMLANSSSTITGVTYAKMQYVSTQYNILGRISASAGVVEELTSNNLVTVLAQATTRTGGTTNIVFDASPTITTPKIDSITTTTGVAATPTLWSDVTTGSVAAGSGLTTGSLNLANNTTFNGTIAIGSGAGTVNKTITIGTASTSGTTAITIGSAAGATSTTLLNGTTTADLLAAASATATSTRLWDNVTTGTPGIVNNAAFNGTLNIASGAGTVNKTVNIGTGSTLGTTTVNIGPTNQAATGTVNINADLVVQRNLTVNGTLTSVNSNTLSVDDKNIELGSITGGIFSSVGTIGTVSGTGPFTATLSGLTSTSGIVPGSVLLGNPGAGSFGSGATVVSIIDNTSVAISSTTTMTAGNVFNVNTGAATDVTANGGGITLKGTTDKTIIWDSANSNWTSNQDWNIPTGKVFKINNLSVLSSTAVLGITRTINATGFTLSGGTTAVGVTFAGGSAYTISGTNGQTYTLPTSGGTLVANPMTTLGDLTYGAASGLPTRLAGNATNGVYFLRENVTASASVAPDWIGSTGSGSVVLATSPAIAGGTHTGLTGLAIRDTSAAFDVTIAATSSTALTAGRSLTLDLINAARTVKLNGNIDLGGNLTTASSLTTAGAFALTLTTTNTTNATIPAGTVTLVDLATSQSLTNKTISGLTVTTTTGTLTMPAATVTHAGAFATTITATGITNATLPAGTTTLAANVGTTIGDITYTSATGTPGARSRLAGNTLVQPAFLTSTGNGTANTTTSFTTSTGSGNVVLATAPAIAGGTHTGLTTLGIRDTSAAFDVTLAATSSTALTAGRSLTFDLINAAKTVKLAGNIDLANNFTTTGAFALTLTTTGATTATLPSGTITLVDLSASQSLTNKTISGLTVTTTTGTLTMPAATVTHAGAFATTITATAITNATLPSGTTTLAANVTTTIGDIVYASATGTPGTLARLAGNTTTTRAFLGQTGNGTNSAAPSWTTSTGTGSVVLATSPAIAGGTLTGLTGLAVRDTSAAFDVTIAAVSSPILTAARILTINMQDAARTISLAGNITLAGTLTTAAAFTTSGAFATTITSTGISNATLPTGTTTLAANVGTTIGDITYTSSTASPGTRSRLAGNTAVQPAFLTSTGNGTTNTTTSFTTSTGSGSVVLGTSPTIAGGTHTALTSLGIRDTSAAFDITIAAVSSVALTAGRSLTIDMINAARSIKLAGNIDIAANFSTSGANSLSLATTGATSVTLPTTGTLAANVGTTIGDITYTSATGTPGARSRLAGNIAAQTSFLASTGNGTANTTTSFISSTGTAGSNVVLATSPTITTPKIDSINTVAGAAATPTIYSDVTTGTIAIGAGITTGTVNIATAGTGANAINIGNTNSTLTVNGNLTVNGTTTTVNSVTITVDDPNLELNSIASPSDANANGGGITLKGTTDKSIIWDTTNTNWTANQHFNIATGKLYKINNTEVLSSTAVLGVTHTINATGFKLSGGTTAKYVQINNDIILAGTDGSTLNIGAGGTLGSAAFTATTAYISSTLMTTLGDTIYGGASGASTRLAGNTTATRRFLRQVGDGINSSAPVWDTILNGDIVTALTGKSYNGLTLTSTTGTFTLADAKTLTVNNTITLSGTDSSTLNIGTGGTLGTAAYTASSTYEPAITTLAISKGGTGTSTAPTQYGIIYAATTTGYESTAKGLDGQVLAGDTTAGTPKWLNVSGFSVLSAGKFTTPVNINGIPFDGTTDITIGLSGTYAALDLTGSTLAANVVTSSLTSVGTLTNLTVSGTVTVPTPSNNTDAANKAYVDSVLNAGVPEIVPLDNISGEFNGLNSRFVPKYQGIAQSITNPLRLLLSINGIIQYVDFPDYVWQSPLPREGFQIDNEGYIAFSEVVPAGSSFDARIMPGPSTATKIRQYPFKAVDILLGG